MFQRSVSEFLNEQKIRITLEKVELDEKLNENKQTKNDRDKEIRECNESEKENIPTKDGNDVKMLKYGEFSPNNPKMRVATQPYIGLGEYEQRRQLLIDQRKADYQQYADKVHKNDTIYVKNNYKGSRAVSSRDKAVQTDIQNVNTQLIQCDLPHQLQKDKVKINKVQIETQNNIIIPGNSKFLSKHSNRYIPAFMGYQATQQDDDRFEKVRRQEKYLAELRQQIEEKQQLLQKHKEQEDLVSKRIEINEKIPFGRQYSTDFSQKLSKYTSPPLSRKPYSFNIPSNSVFANSKLSLTNLTTNKKSNTKLEESLPIPVLKAQSPVAKELINAVVVTSQQKTSDAIRKLEDKWQIPAVQKNIFKEKVSDGGILTQLGAIRLQLQQEQLRLDETLRKRGTSQIVQADVHL